MTDSLTQQQMEFARADGDNKSSSGSLDQNLQIDMEKIESLSQTEHGQLPGHKLTIFQTSLALLATNIGAGLLGMAYAYYRMGLFLGIILCVTVALLSWLSSMMYLKTKDLTPRRYESMYEIAYLLLGRPSIFIICIILFLANSGCCIMYYIIIGDTVSSFAEQTLIGPAEGKTVSQVEAELDEYPSWVKIACSKQAAIILAGLVQLGVIFKRQLEELKIVSYIFLALVFSFIVLLFSELMTDSVKVSETVNYDDLTRPKKDLHLLTAFFIILFGYFIQFMIFPSYVEMEKRSTERYSKALTIYTVLVTVAFLSVGILGAIMFGD